MKKKTLILAGVLSCFMLAFSVQADDATKDTHDKFIMGDAEMDSSMPGHGCEGRDLRGECPEAVKRGENLDRCCRDYCSKHPEECGLVK